MTPRRLAALALAPMLVLVVLELAGARSMTATLAGSRVESPMLGLCYVATWLATVLLAPPLLLAAVAVKGLAMAKRCHR